MKSILALLLMIQFISTGQDIPPMAPTPDCTYPCVAKESPAEDLIELDLDSVPLIPDTTGKYTQDKVYDFCEKSAEYPGGMELFFKELASNLNYPTSYGCIEGKVFVEFVVNTDDKLSDFKILKGLNDAYNNAAIDAIKKSKPWIPGEINGKKVKQLIRIPVSFKMD